MPSHFCITIRFLQPLSHGRGDSGEPEWPPSPLRVFQALVAAAAARWNERMRLEYAKPALQWLAKQRPPTVVAAIGVPSGATYRLYVPDNVGDRVAKSWRGGHAKASIADYRTEKDVRPTLLVGDAVRYLYPIDDEAEFATHRDTLTAAAKSITHLGWGVDMVAGDAAPIQEVEAAKYVGERWQPTTDGAGLRLRVPRRDENNAERDTLSALMQKHTAFLNRLDNDNFAPVPPLTAFDIVGYRRDTDLVERPLAVFEVQRTVAELASLPAGQSRFRPFDPVRTPAFARTPGAHDPCGTVVVAGLVRHATAQAAQEQGWSAERVREFVLGHGEQGAQATTDNRLMYLPLPSITPLRVESIRRVLIAAPPGEDLTRVRQLLNGRELISRGRSDPVAMLAVSSPSDTTVTPYLRASRVWSTVTPVVLPGFDDPDGVRRRLQSRDTTNPMHAEEKRRQLAALDRRVCDLLLRAFQHAGVGAGLMSLEKLDSGEAGLEWRDVGFRPGLDLARRYYLATPQYPRYHVRVRFAHPVRGPLAVGAGRYRGLGLFATEDD
jgi:CRISPR-associated protein Csb2